MAMITEPSYIQLLDSNGNAVEAQAAYDAAMSGPIYATGLSSNASTYTQSKPPAPTIKEEACFPLLLGSVLKDNGTMVGVIFICPILTGKYFYAGTDPSTLG